jgi:hypothetical protein
MSEVSIHIPAGTMKVGQEIRFPADPQEHEHAKLAARQAGRLERSERCIAQLAEQASDATDDD